MTNLNAAQARLASHYLALATVLSIPLLGAAQTDRAFWRQPDTEPTSLAADQLLGDIPTLHTSRTLDLAALREYLTANQGPSGGPASFIVPVPTPTGGSEDFVLTPTTVVAPEVAQYYTIETFAGHAVADARRTIRCDLSAAGFHAVVDGGSDRYVVEPVSRSQPERHVVYFKRDATASRCAAVPPMKGLGRARSRRSTRS